MLNRKLDDNKSIRFTLNTTYRKLEFGASLKTS